MKKTISLTTLFSVVFVLLAGLTFSSPKEVDAQNIGSLQSIVTSGFSFNKDLMLGDTDPDVKELQKVLNADVDTVVAVAPEDIGSRGKESTYFGSATKAAVIKFQNKYKDVILTPSGLTVGNGAVNKLTRTKLNLLIGVMVTSDSVGSPQSRASSPAVYVSPAPTIIPATQSNVSICSFVELLINIGAITPDKANQARSAIGCTTTVNNASTNTSICQFVELLINIGAVAPDKANQARSALGCSAGIATNSSVDLKVNHSNGPITVSKNSTISVSWTTTGVFSCSSGSQANKALAGSENYTMRTSNKTFTLTCQTVTGARVSDSVLVRVSGASSDDEDPILLNTSNYTFGYNLATFNIYTNVPTKSYITYRTNSSDAQTVSFTTFRSSRSETITGLTPDTTYYVKIEIVDADDNDFISGEFEGKTTATMTATSTKSLSIYVNNQKNYSTTADPMSSSYINPTVSWTSSGFSACKVTSNPMVTSLYEVPVVLNGSLSASILPMLHQGTTTFTLACATGTATTTLNQNMVSTLSSSANLWLATSTLYLSAASSTSATTTLSAAATASSTVDDGTSTRVDFSGQVTSVLSCYDDNGSPKSRFSQIIVSPCSASSPVVARAYEYQSSTGLELGSVNGSQYGEGSSNPVMFLYDSVDGHSKPVVGQTILGVANTKAEDAAEKCPRTSPSGSLSGVPAGTKVNGYLLDYEVGNTSCTGGIGASSGGSSGSGLFQGLGELMGGITGGLVGGATGIIGGGTGVVIGGALGYDIGSSIGGSVGSVADSITGGW